MPVYSDQSKEYLKQLIQIFRRITLLGSASGPDSINTTIGSALPTGTNTIGNVGLLPTSVSSGTTRVRSLTTNSTATVLKATAGNVYGWNIVSNNSLTIYVKIYNIAAATVNPASDVPIKTLMVPANGSVYQEPNCIQMSGSTALSFRAVTDFGDTGTTAPATLPIIEFEIV